MTKTFPEVISGIRTAKKGVEVREDIAQMGEYVEQFAQTATEKAAAAAASEEKASAAVKNIDQQTEDAVTAITTAESKALTDVETARSGALTDIGTARAGALEDIETARTGAVQSVTDTKTAALTELEEKRASALQEMQASVDAAAGSAEKAAASEGNAKASEDASKASEEAAAKSEAAAKASQEAAATSEANALKYSQEAGAKAGTDKTLTIEDAPADAKQTGEELALRYTKEQVDALLAQLEAKIKDEDHPKGSLFFSDDPTSPAERFGGTWEQIKDRFILAAGDTYAAGSTGGSATVSISQTNLPRVALDVITAYTRGALGYAYDVVNITYEHSDGSGNFSRTGRTSLLGDGTPLNVLPPYITKYVWQRIE